MSLKAENPENFQAGYVIIGQDTVNGFIRDSDQFLATKQCVFKQTPTGQERIYTAEDIIGYGVYNKSFYDAAIIRGENSGTIKVFLTCLVKNSTGPSLYSHRSRFFVKSANEIEELEEVKIEVTKNGKIFNEKRPFYKSILQKHLNDCSTIHERVLNSTLTEKSLVNLFKDHAACTGRDATVFDVERIRTKKTRYGFTVGLLATNLKLQSDNNHRYIFGEYASRSTSFNFTPSFFFELRLSNRFDLCSGINWYSTKHDLHSENTANNLTHKFSFEVSRIELPILVKYSISQRTVKWSLKGGGGLNHLIKYENRLVISSTGSGYVLNEYVNDLKKNSLVLNAMGGLCAEFLLGNRSCLVEGYFSRTGSIVSTETHASISGFKLAIGVFL